VSSDGFNLAALHERLSAELGARECIVFRDRRLSWADVGERTRRFANALGAAGLGARPGGRRGLDGHESHQDHLAIYAYNGNEYLESMIGAFKARVAPLNVNYRYVADELRYVLADARASAVVYDSAFAETLASVLPDLPDVRLLVQIGDGPGPLLDGAVRYEDLLASASADLPSCRGGWSPDDLYVLYTGGTTGMPKGVLWRQHDIFLNVLGGRMPMTGVAHDSLESVVQQAVNGGGRALPCAPFMHGASQWVALMTMHAGGTVVLPDAVDRFDAESVLRAIEAEQASVVQIVGDAFARPLAATAARTSFDRSSVAVVISGGAALSPRAKELLLDTFPSAMVVDGLGSSEAGTQVTQVTVRGGTATSGAFGMVPGGTEIADDDLRALLGRDDERVGWLARTGDVPLGYLGDRAKTQATFPTIGGVRYAVPGDRARWRPDGSVEVLGRESATINTGGEKVFAEEVEAALLRSTAVDDVLVCGTPDERWGHAVVAVVQLADGLEPGPDLEADLASTAAAHLARYKLPKRYRFVPTVQRSPSGKPDYAWARAIAAEG
jgi:fatty-acyl-CoA synthase